MSIKENAKQLKKEIQKLGLKYNEVSVKSGYCGYSDYIDVIIKKEIPQDIADKIKMLCTKYERYDRDEVTGEILLGGNTYVTARYSNGYSI